MLEMIRRENRLQGMGSTFYVLDIDVALKMEEDFIFIF